MSPYNIENIHILKFYNFNFNLNTKIQISTYTNTNHNFCIIVHFINQDIKCEYSVHLC